MARAHYVPRNRVPDTESPGSVVEHTIVREGSQWREDLHGKQILFTKAYAERFSRGPVEPLLCLLRRSLHKNQGAHVTIPS